MALSKELQKALNDQYNFELESAYIYLGMAGDCTGKDYAGAAHFLQEQAKEEVEHAMKFYEFITDMDGAVALQGMAEPKNEYGSLLEVMETALAHEKKVTSNIYAIAQIATKEESYDTLQFLNWFFEEQREEENTFKPLVARLKGIQDLPAEIHRLDAELGRR